MLTRRPPPPPSCSPIFGTSFLEAPFPPGLAVSGGVYGGDEQAELTLWELW